MEQGSTTELLQQPNSPWGLHRVKPLASSQTVSQPGPKGRNENSVDNTIRSNS